jgi:D-alanine--poly(phosphoribitol) ligase subunit 1
MCLVERTFNADLMPGVRRFLFCGETLSVRTVRTLRQRFPAAEIWNFYGPTEATVATTSVRLDESLLATYSSLPVGRPMRGTELFLVDEQGKRVSVGQRGEIVIKGPNVSPGYLGRPDLTAAQFFQEDGVRAYRTGDWGRVCDGLVFFEGRMDNQIKLNGYRIELADLETNLRALSMVRDAAVVPKLKNGKVQWLAGFIVPNNRLNGESNSLANTIRERLRERLPAYMLPRKFILVDAFPITANGKVDRARLAASL